MNIFLPSWNELISYWDKFLPFLNFGSINTRLLFSFNGFHLGCAEGHISPISKNLGSYKDKFFQMTKWPNVMVGNISPILKWANIMLRQISPLFQKFGFIYSRTLFSDYGFHLRCEEGHISPTFKNLVQRQTNSSKWWNNITWCWDIFLPSWN